MVIVAGRTQPVFAFSVPSNWRSKRGSAVLLTVVFAGAVIVYCWRVAVPTTMNGPVTCDATGTLVRPLLLLYVKSSNGLLFLLMVIVDGMTQPVFASSIVSIAIPCCATGFRSVVFEGAVMLYVLRTGDASISMLPVMRLAGIVMLPLLWL